MRRVIGFCVMILCLGVSGALAQGQKALLAKKIVGAWRLVSVEGQPPGLPAFYDHPTGLIVYDPSGTMSVQIANRSGRKKFAGGLGAGARRKRRRLSIVTSATTEPIRSMMQREQSRTTS
jgi:hypothetical protein